MRLEQADDVAKIFGVIANHDGDAVSSGLNNIVPTLRDEAATDEGDIGEAIDGGEFADRVEKQHAPRQRLAAPERTSQEMDAEAFEQGSDGGKALRMARREDHRGMGIAGEDVLKSLQEHALLLVVSRATTNQDRGGTCDAEAVAEICDHGWRLRRFQVELQIAGHFDARLGRANVDQAVAVFLSLRQE